MPIDRMRPGLVVGRVELELVYLEFLITFGLEGLDAIMISKFIL